LIIVETILGNVADADWKLRLEGADLDWLALDHWEAQKNRFRKRSASGLELAVSLDRGTFLRDGDILAWDEPARRATVARISLRDVMIVHLDQLVAAAPHVAMQACVELGHALGNQHWPALVKGTRVFVPLTVDRKVMASVMNTHRFEHVRYEFVPGSEIIPYLAPHESRRLFGGAEGPVHSHVYDHAVPASRAPVRPHPHGYD
jgi:urease accessory protein